MAYDPWAQPLADWSNPAYKKNGVAAPVGQTVGVPSLSNWTSLPGGGGSPAGQTNTWGLTPQTLFGPQPAGGASSMGSDQGHSGGGSFATNPAFDSAMGNAQGNMDSFLSAGAPQPTSPTMQSNRFEGALTDSQQRLQALLDNPSSIADSAAYKFRVQQQEEALNRQLGAKGLLNSGNRIAAIADRGQQLASTEYEAEYGRRAGLYGTNVGAYNTNEQANTNRYSAEGLNANQQYQTASTANTARGNTLADLLKNAGTQYNTAQKIASDNETKWGEIIKAPRTNMVGGRLITQWG